MRTHRRVRALTGTCAHSQAQRQTPHHKRARAREKRRGKGVGELAAGGARAGRRDAGRGHGQNRGGWGGWGGGMDRIDLRLRAVRTVSSASDAATAVPHFTPK